MCNTKHLLTTALNVLKMIKQEGNFSQRALTDGFSNNELAFGAAWGWERSWALSQMGALGLCCFGCSHKGWEWVMGWGEGARPGQSGSFPIPSPECRGEKLPLVPLCSERRWCT